MHNFNLTEQVCKPNVGVYRKLHTLVRQTGLLNNMDIHVKKLLYPHFVVKQQDLNVCKSKKKKTAQIVMKAILCDSIHSPSRIQVCRYYGRPHLCMRKEELH